MSKQSNLFTFCLPDFSARACLGATEDAPMVNVTLTCPEGKVISLGEVVSSVNRYGCINALGDCTDTTDVFNPCQRQRECTVTLNRTYSPICTAYATQLKVYYVCEIGQRIEALLGALL